MADSFIGDNFFEPLQQRLKNKAGTASDDAHKIYLQTRAQSLINLQNNPKEMDKFEQLMKSNDKPEGAEF